MMTMMMIGNGSDPVFYGAEVLQASSKNIEDRNTSNFYKTRYNNFSTYLPENNINCSLSFRIRYHLFLMSFLFRPLPNSDAILET